MDIGVTIKDYLKERGITQKLNLALNGGRRTSLDEYARICYALEVNTDKFLKPRAPDEKGERR